MREIITVLKLSLPRSIGLGLNQGVLVIFTAIASALGVGSISIFQLAYNLYSVPMGVIGLSYSVAAFPGFARRITEGKTKEFVDEVVRVSRHIVFWSLPAVVLFIVLRAHIVRVILGAGAFGWADTRLTAAALALFSVAILAQGLVLLLVRAFYAAGRTMFPLAMNTIASSASIGIGWGCIRLLASDTGLRFALDSLLRVSDIPQTAVLILVAAFSIGSVLNVILLWAGFAIFFDVRSRDWARALAEHGAASLALGGVSYGFLQWTNQWFNLQTFLGVLGHGALAALGGISAAIAVLWFLKNEELSTSVGTLHRRFWREPVVAPEPVSPSQG